jgi:orotidine-5'-phosphate decarboxylase
MTNAEGSRLYVAVTGSDVDSGLLDRLSDLPVGVKIGLELFTARGPSLPELVKDMGFSLFLDLKFHDIPFTVAGAVRSACSLEPDLMNVHGMGGMDMMRAAAEAAAPPSRVIAVTLLTSLDSEDLREIGMEVESMKDTVVSIALRAKEAGLSGVVCSPLEAAAVRESAGEGFLIVTPGIRPSAPEGSRIADDQKRKATPFEAISRGATSLVVGRPITTADDPRAAAISIIEEINNAL